MARQLTPQLREDILLGMLGASPRRPTQPEPQPVQQEKLPPQFAGPVRRGFSGMVNPVANPVFTPKQPVQQFAGPVQRGFQGQADLAPSQQEQARERMQMFANQLMGMNQGFGQGFDFPMQQTMGNRPHLFAQNFASNFDQMRAAQQGAMNTARTSQRPFANYFAGRRAGRGGLQPVASQQDAANRQNMQEIFARNNRFSTSSGAPAGRRLSRRNVFAQRR